MKTNTRNGKIARLPRLIRNELNQRLAEGEMGTKLVRWLNGLPEVKEVLYEYFEGKPVSEQNLSEWKAGGFEEWLTKQEVLEQARDLNEQAEDWREATGTAGSLSEHLAAVLTVRYAGVLAEWKGEASEGLTKQLRLLHVMAHDVARLARVGLERQRLDTTREKSQAELVDLFRQWVELPEVSQAVRGKYADPEDRNRVVAHVYGKVYPGDEGKSMDEIKEEIRLKNEVCRCRHECQCLKEKGRRKQSRIKPKKGATKSDHPSPSIPLPVEGRGKSKGEAFVGDPLKGKAGRKRWVKDPTSCDEHGQDKEKTNEERARSIRRIYGRPEEGAVNFSKMKSVEEGYEQHGSEEAKLSEEEAPNEPSRETGAPALGNQTGSNPIKPLKTNIQSSTSKDQGPETEWPNPAHFTNEYWTKERVDKLEQELAAEDDPVKRAEELRQWKEEEEHRQWKKENNFE